MHGRCNANTAVSFSGRKKPPGSVCAGGVQASFPFYNVCKQHVVAGRDNAVLMVFAAVPEAEIDGLADFLKEGVQMV